MAAPAPGPDLEVLDVDPVDGHGSEPQARPHPLGTRDVIDVLVEAARYALIAGAVALAAVLGYLVGTANRPLVVNRSPISAPGVLWACGGTLSGPVHLSGLPPGIVELAVGGRLVVGTDDARYGTPDAPRRYLVNDAGSLDATATVDDPGGGPQISLAARTTSGETVLETTILRVPCR